MEELVYVGKIISLDVIPNADFIVSATVVCGSGGKWKGIVRKSDFQNGDLCVVFLPDSLIPECDEMAFMKATHWRVKMRRFKGAASEVVIMPISARDRTLGLTPNEHIGLDVTEANGVTKYQKPISPHLAGFAEGDFPGFIPRTDEPNYQRSQDLINSLIGQPYYISEKCDGSSTTAYKYKGKFGVCSRNVELKETAENGYWLMANKYNLSEKLPENIALQWETCGPGIQSNPMGLKEISAFAFSGFNIQEQRYLTWHEFIHLCDDIDFPRCRSLDIGLKFDSSNIDTLGEGKYKNGSQREGVVVRSKYNLLGHKPISFKVINLNYEK